jgi:long-chain acyl-CoA synthetase
MPTLTSFTTLNEMFAQIFDHFKGRNDKAALMRKINGSYQPITHDELRADVESLASYLVSVGVAAGDRVALLSENRPEWVVADMAILSIGAIHVPLYPSLPPNQIGYILQNAECKAIVASSPLQVSKVRKVLDECPTITKVISIAKIESPSAMEIEYTDALRLGREYFNAHPNHIAAVKTNEEDLATLIYTSGTTGNPKGVMLTHRNIVQNVYSSSHVLRIDETDRVLSFLPLCHTYERTAGYYLMFACGVTIYYAESIETVSLNLTEAKPTLVVTVPRLFERIKSTIFKSVDSGSPTKKKIFYWALAVGYQMAKVKREKRTDPLLALQHKIADALVFSKLRDRFGGQIRFFVSGGAALPHETGEFFEAAGIIVLEGFGLTETSPVTNVNRLELYKFGTVGPVVKNVQMKIAEDGEILFKGPNIMKGYWRDEAATKEVFTADGWFQTGDIGVIDADGYLKITDRKKHIIVNSGGKNIAPLPIENMILSNRYVEQAIVLGEKRQFLVALIVPNFDSLKGYAAEQGIAYKSDDDITQQPQIKKLFESFLKQINKELASHEKVRKFQLLTKQFTIDSGEMTPTLKIKRKVVSEKYADVIDELYKGVVYESE